MRVAVLEGELRRRLADVHAVRTTTGIDTVAVSRKFRRINQHLSSATQDALLVVMKVAVAQSEVSALRTNSGAVQIGDARPGELDVLDDGIVALDHPDRLALGILARGRDVS